MVAFDTHAIGLPGPDRTVTDIYANRVRPDTDRRTRTPTAHRPAKHH
ncbi:MULTISPECIES: hypothetical protein [unclassified Nonomuraea]